MSLGTTLHSRQFLIPKSAKFERSVKNYYSKIIVSKWSILFLDLFDLKMPHFYQFSSQQVTSSDSHHNIIPVRSQGSMNQFPRIEYVATYEFVVRRRVFKKSFNCGLQNSIQMIEVLQEAKQSCIFLWLLMDIFVLFFS